MELNRRITDPLGSEPEPDSHQMIGGYLAWLEEKRASSPNTMRSYRSVLTAWQDWCQLNGIRMGAATRGQMEAFLHRPRTKRGKGGTGAARTIRRDVSVLRSFYKWCVGEGWLHIDPAANLVGPKAPGENPRPIPNDDWFDFWHTDMTPQLRVVLGLGVYAGLRRAEMVALTCDKIGPEWIENFVRKGGSEHSLPWRTMMEVCCRKLNGHRSRWTTLFVDELDDVTRTLGPHGLLTPWSMSPNVSTVNRQLEKHGVPWTPHQMRHSCATNLIKAGVPLHLVRQYMHHQSIQTTMLYAAVHRDDLSEWLNAGPGGGFDQ